jgi:hypothetical protein
VRERPSGLRGFAVATPGVSHGDNVDLAVRPVSVATDVDLLFGPASPAANQAAGLRTSGYAVVMAPLSGGLAALRGYRASGCLRQMSASILAGPETDPEPARRLEYEA